jgi:hypothetical protein
MIKHLKMWANGIVLDVKGVWELAMNLGVERLPSH